MKKVIVALALMLGVSLSTFAQDYSVKRGYKGFIDFGYSQNVGMDGVANEISGYDSNKIFWSTSHGYQFNPYLYLGAGVAANYYFDAECFGLPFFAHVRGNILNNKISPYVDFRIGYSPLEDVRGFYMAPSIGCKIYSFNVSLGYVMQKITDSYYDISENFSGFSLKVGFEF